VLKNIPTFAANFSYPLLSNEFLSFSENSTFEFMIRLCFNRFGVPLVSNPSLRSFLHTIFQRFCQTGEPCPNPYSLPYCSKDGGERSGGGGGAGEDLSLNTDFFTDKTRPNCTSQPFTLHCNKKSIHAAGDHHGSRQNIRLVRTRTYTFRRQF
jgi:hypothetical protein